MLRLHIDNFEAVAFDFDGTLANTNAVHNAARNEAFAIMAELTGDDTYLQVSDAVNQEAHTHGSNPYEIIGWVLKEIGVVPKQSNNLQNDIVLRTVDLKKAQYRLKVEQGLPEINGASIFVKRVSAKKPGKLAIVTTEHREIVTPYLDRYELTECFDGENIVTNEDVTQPKPDPEAYIVALGRLGLENSPSRLLVIEDSPLGVAAAKQAGTAVIAIETTHSAEQFEVTDPALRPDKVVRDYLHLSNTVQV